MCVVRFASIALGKQRAVRVAEALTRFCNCVGEAAHSAGGQEVKEVAKSVVCRSSSCARFTSVMLGKRHTMQVCCVEEAAHNTLGHLAAYSMLM